MRKLAIESDGSIVAVYGDDLAPLIAQGTATITRASNVEPMLGGWAVAMVDDTSSAAVELFVRTFRLRSEALAAEVAYLERRLGLSN